MVVVLQNYPPPPPRKQGIQSKVCKHIPLEENKQQWTPHIDSNLKVQGVQTVMPGEACVQTYIHFTTYIE